MYITGRIYAKKNGVVYIKQFYSGHIYKVNRVESIVAKWNHDDPNSLMVRVSMEEAERVDRSAI